MVVFIFKKFLIPQFVKEKKMKTIFENQTVTLKTIYQPPLVEVVTIDEKILTADGSPDIGGAFPNEWD